MSDRRMRLFLPMIVAMGLLGAACGDDGGTDGEAGATTASATSASTQTATTGRTPVTGGSVTMAATRAMTTFDPTVISSTFGCCGGTELAAFYDVLLRYNPESQKYEGRTAQSFEPSPDFVSWTLKVKPGIKFTDGTDYNADAVKFNLDRHLAAASRSALKPVLTPFLDTVSVFDPLTLQIKLKRGWAGLPTVFAREGGMIASPTAVQKAGADFGVNPGNAGAGPFMLGSFKPNEALELRKNPNYWGGAVYLDTLRFVSINGGDGPSTSDALKSGTLQIASIRDPVAVAANLDAKTPGFRASLVPFLTGVIMNSGGTVTCSGGQPAIHCTGKPDGTRATINTPTADVNVRRAVAAAVDPKLISDRVYNGKANPTNEVFPSPLPWSPGVPGVKYDVNEAKRLVGVARAAGWNGKIRLTTTDTPTAVTFGVAVKTALEGAGMEVVTDAVAVTQISPKVIVNRDFDVALFALGFSDDPDNNYAQIALSFSGDNPRYGYSSADVDGGLDALRLANTNEARKAAMSKIATALTRDAPFVSYTMGEEHIFMSAKLNGVQLDGQGRVNFDKAWLG